jgi:hypothetical protein
MSDDDGAVSVAGIDAGSGMEKQGYLVRHAQADVPLSPYNVLCTSMDFQ